MFISEFRMKDCTIIWLTGLKTLCKWWSEASYLSCLGAQMISLLTNAHESNTVALKLRNCQKVAHSPHSPVSVQRVSSAWNKALSSTLAFRDPHSLDMIVTLSLLQLVLPCYDCHLPFQDSYYFEVIMLELILILDATLLYMSSFTENLSCF